MSPFSSNVPGESSTSPRQHVFKTARLEGCTTLERAARPWRRQHVEIPTSLSQSMSSKSVQRISRSSVRLSDNVKLTLLQITCFVSARLVEFTFTPISFKKSRFFLQHRFLEFISRLFNYGNFVLMHICFYSSPFVLACTHSCLRYSTLASSRPEFIFPHHVYLCIHIPLFY